MRHYAIKVVAGFVGLFAMAVFALAHGEDPVHKTDPHGYTLIIITETYHGTSSVAVSGYPTLTACGHALNAVRVASEQMADEKETDFLYTDAYCIPSYGKL